MSVMLPGAVRVLLGSGTYIHSGTTRYIGRYVRYIRSLAIKRLGLGRENGHGFLAYLLSNLAAESAKISGLYAV